MNQEPHAVSPVHRALVDSGPAERAEGRDISAAGSKFGPLAAFDLVEIIAAETAPGVGELPAEAREGLTPPMPGRGNGNAPQGSRLPESDTAPGLDAPERTTPPAAASGTPLSAFVGFCVEERHPSLAGRVLVRVAESSGTREVWVATLAHLPVRREDCVLLLQPANWPEPLVVGVVNGLRERTRASHAAAALTLKDDQTLEIRDPDGTPLLAIAPSASGPVLRLARADQRLEVAGRLVLAADAISLAARGEVSVDAGGDVVVTGEEIKLN